jgi:hypothetical protein
MISAKELDEIEQRAGSDVDKLCRELRILSSFATEIAALSPTMGSLYCYFCGEAPSKYSDDDEHAHDKNCIWKRASIYKSLLTS